MIYFIGLLMSLAAGFFLIQRLSSVRLNAVLHILLGLALGLGIAGTAAFYTHIFLNCPNRFLPVGLVILAIFLLAPQKKWDTLTFRLTKSQCVPLFCGLLALGLLAIPLAISAHYYPYGGWDAWSCWNLKAKFIFLGQGNWKDMLSPGLWRSNTHYPLLWPLMNVWFCDLGGKFDQSIPMLNSIVIALLTAGILLFGLLELTGELWIALPATVLVTALPFNVTLYASQYSDSLLGLYLLSAFICLLLAEKYQAPKLKILCMVFLGFLGFTKNEGLIAAGITALLIFWHERRHKKELKSLIMAFFAALLPTVIFMIFIAPRNEAFINGLTSTEKPTTWARLTVIFAYPWFEFISDKWNGFWLLVLGAIVLAGKKLWQPTLRMMGVSLLLYLAGVFSYYAVNTFFEVQWWLSTTLSRILFALIPTVTLWICLGLKLKAF